VHFYKCQVDSAFTVDNKDKAIVVVVIVYGDVMRFLHCVNNGFTSTKLHTFTLYITKYTTLPYYSYLHAVCHSVCK